MNIPVPAHMYASLRQKAGLPPAYIDGLHDKQLGFVRDKSKRKAGLTGRRGGKTHGVGTWLLDGAHEAPKRKSLFVALTRGKAKSLLWDDCLSPMNERLKLGLRLHHDEGQLYIVHPNGHRIWLIGIDDRGQIDKVRGEKLHRVVVDEAQAFGDYLQELCEESIEPALMDYEGELALTGTPNPITGGYFWAITTGGNPDIAKWPVHHWTVLDNPFIPHAKQWLEEKRARNNWDESHPTYRREYLGEWTEDSGSLVYPISAANYWQPSGENPYGLYDGEYSFGLGVDLGFSQNSTAFTLGAVRRGTGQIYLLSSYTRSRLIPTALAAHVQATRETVKELTRPWGGCGLRVVVDEGALGKGYAEQMRVMGVACEPAEKSEKRTYQEFVRGLIMMGSAPEPNGNGGSGLLIDTSKCRELIDECKTLQFDDETGKEDERYTRHCADSMLYLCRAMVPRYDPRENEPAYGSPEALKLEMRREREKRIREVQKRNKVMR
jgi:hypothetical protein